MGSRLSDIKANIKAKKQSLRSLCAGAVLFCFLRFITQRLEISVCIFKNLFGVPCPGCGLTRGFISILRLDFKSALRYNILSVPIFAALVIYTLLLFFDIAFGKDCCGKIERLLLKKQLLPVLILLYFFSVILNRITP